jgi:2-oxoglutarate/2-oxoacid ferredoxin oxidoreductase subunit alpha
VAAAQVRQARPEVAEANIAASGPGWAFGETTEMFATATRCKPAAAAAGHLPPDHRQPGAVLRPHRRRPAAGLPLFLGGYPITPASDILHELSRHKHFGVKTVQAEDEIAGIGAALGAAFAGSLAATTVTSGPGVALKAETIGLAVSVELPLIIINVQRGGPSTGLPTKTEQSDLLQAMYGRNGDSPCRSSRPDARRLLRRGIEAARIALKYRTPVILLSDGYLANGAEPWRSPTSPACPT